MAEKILILGATGMAGHLVCQYLLENTTFKVLNAVYRNKFNTDSFILDVTNEGDIVNLINTVQPDIIINCIGVLINGSRNNSSNAIFINSYLPHFLSKICKENNIKLIHISTDCVFSGRRGNYHEDDFRDADDIYGRSKALGELINERDLTIRTSIIGPEIKLNGEGLFHWFMNQEGKIKGYSNAIWGGVTTLELAKAIEKAISDNISGLVHLSNGLGINKFELLNLFKTIWRKDVEIIEDGYYKINKTLVKSNKFHFEVSSYEIMLQEMKNWMDAHSTLYKDIYKW